MAIHANSKYVAIGTELYLRRSEVKKKKVTAIPFIIIWQQ